MIQLDERPSQNLHVYTKMMTSEVQITELHVPNNVKQVQRLRK